MNNLKAKTMVQKSSFSEIYNDPLSFIRAFDKINLENEENYSAYLAAKPGVEVPRRLTDSGLYIMSNSLIYQ